MENNQTFKALVGTLLDKRYKIEKLLGTGGMSVVFKATDITDGSAVTIKMLRDEIADDKDALAGFINESKAVSMLSHPNIVSIRAMSVKTRRKYLVMEYIDGISLRTYMDRRGALDFDEVISFSEQILAALEHAHSRGIVHRDIKPQNILVLKDGIIKVTDFGIAKLPESAKGDTMTDNAIGTAFYISPEQAAAKPTDHRSDLYSFGVMMYEMATGALPFDDDRPMAVLMMHIDAKPIRPRKLNRRIPIGLERLILTSMEKDPRNRYQTAKDMFLQVRRLRQNPLASVPSPKQLAANARSHKNRTERPPSRSFFPVALGIACAVAFVGLVSVLYGLDFLNFGSPGTASLKVPNAEGLEYTEGIEESLGFNSKDYIVTVEYVNSSTVEKGFIISQKPLPDSRRKSPCSVTLTVSLGPKEVTFGDYLMMNWRVAQTKLRGEGYVVTVVRKENAAIPEGYVYATDPMPGSKIQPGSTVTIYVSAGTEQRLVTIPEFKGMSEREAKTKLDELALLVGKVIYTRSPQPAGTVLSASLEAGSNAYSYITAIDFIVSGGPSYEHVNYCPDVLGKEAAPSLEELELYGMSVTLITVRDEAAAGTVILQSPSAQECMANASSDVTLTVSGGPTYVQTVEMMDFVGKTETSARAILDYVLEGKCAYTVTVEYVMSLKPRGTILSQTPQAGIVEVSSGVLEIHFVLSGGPGFVPPPQEFTVPDVIGLTYLEARQMLDAAGIILSGIEYEENDAAINTVIAQSIDGETVVYGQPGEITIYLTLGKGPAQETTTPETSTP
ncbi:MAG: PASTA domain-containing protein [Eubacteriales bacterium]